MGSRLWLNLLLAGAVIGSACSTKDRGLPSNTLAGEGMPQSSLLAFNVGSQLSLDAESDRKKVPVYFIELWLKDEDQWAGLKFDEATISIHAQLRGETNPREVNYFIRSKKHQVENFPSSSPWSRVWDYSQTSLELFSNRLRVKVPIEADHALLKETMLAGFITVELMSSEKTILAERTFVRADTNELVFEVNQNAKPPGKSHLNLHFFQVEGLNLEKAQREIDFVNQVWGKPCGLTFDWGMLVAFQEGMEPLNWLAQFSPDLIAIHKTLHSRTGAGRGLSVLSGVDLKYPLKSHSALSPNSKSTLLGLTFFNLEHFIYSYDQGIYAWAGPIYPRDFVIVGREKTELTLAHELGHVFTQSSEHERDDKNVLFQSVGPHSEPIATAEQCRKARVFVSAQQ